ncbi:hypothetical protein [Actinoplanes sp. GCM10030250]|uniref:hypothetical protein n=1 Tax=Actinoplanes sp. GCM10030250 TaxID=3273376 RepID=UPI00361DF091
MLWVLCVALLLGSGFILYKALAPFRRIWSGEAAAAAELPSQFGPVPARNYLAYLLWVTPAALAGTLVSLGLLLNLITGSWTGLAVIPRTGFVLFLVSLPLTLLHVLVSATNRPSFLVPPPYRDQPGAITAARNRRTPASPSSSSQPNPQLALSGAKQPPSHP